MVLAWGAGFFTDWRNLTCDLVLFSTSVLLFRHRGLDRVPPEINLILGRLKIVVAHGRLPVAWSVSLFSEIIWSHSISTLALEHFLAPYNFRIHCQLRIPLSTGFRGHKNPFGLYLPLLRKSHIRLRL
jgi:hypothetical protein